MSNYELVVIFDATRPEEEIKAATGRVRELLDSFKCEITYVEEWGRRKMTFPIKKKIEGWYVVFYFRVGDENYPATELERYARITDIVLRHMLCRVPKLKTEADARREQAMREAEQALRDEQRAKAIAAAEARTAAEQAPAAAEEPAAAAVEEAPAAAEAPVAAEEAAPAAEPSPEQE